MSSGQKLIKNSKDMIAFFRAFEHSLNDFDDIARFKKEVQKIYVNKTLLKKASNLLTLDKQEALYKTSRGRETNRDQCLSISPFCFATRVKRSLKDRGSILKSVDFLDILKYNYFEPFAFKNTSVNSNPVPMEEMADFSNLNNRFTSFRESNLLGRATTNHNNEPNIYTSLPLFVRGKSYENGIRHKSALIEYHDIQISDDIVNGKQNFNKESTNVEEKKAIEFSKSESHNSEDDKNSEQIFPVYEHQFEKLYKFQEEISIRRFQFWQSHSFDGKGSGRRSQPQPAHTSPSTPNRDYHTEDDVENRPRVSKSEFSTMRPKMIIDKQAMNGMKLICKTNAEIENSILITRSEHVCYLKAIDKHKLKENRKLKQIFFEKSNRLVNKHLGKIHEF